MSKISKAVENCLNTIAVEQQNIVALQVISRRLFAGREDREARDAITLLHGKLYERLARAWEQLAWFAPINQKALELLAERTRTWFERDDTVIMHWLGQDGSYLAPDKEAFRREVLAMFNVSPPELPPIGEMVWAFWENSPELEQWDIVRRYQADDGTETGWEARVWHGPVGMWGECDPPTGWAPLPIALHKIKEATHD